MKDATNGPYEDEDFIFEGYKAQKECEMYRKGVESEDGNKCLDGNKSLDSHPRWENTTENKDWCFAYLRDAGKKTRASHFENAWKAKRKK